MKCRITNTSYESDYSSGLKIELGGLSIEFIDGEPEDNNLSRNFNDCYSIVDLLKAAHELGIKGEPLEIEKIERTVKDGDEDEDE